MTNIATGWSAACTHVPGGAGTSMSWTTGSGMSAFGLAVIVRKPATVDARYTAQGDHRAWSPPV